MSGTAVLVVVGLLGAALAGWFLLRSQPVQVVAPAPGSVVEQPAPAVGPGPHKGDASGSGAAGSSTPASKDGEVVAGEVVVAVAGTVVRPGVVRLPAGSRVVDAVDAAGGPLPGADTGLLNLARILTDGEQVLVGVEPPPAVPGAGAGTGAGADAADGRLDLNRATAGDLDELPGVGPVLAERIVAHRDSVGGFSGVEQLREVSGIGDSRYAELEPLVVVP